MSCVLQALCDGQETQCKSESVTTQLTGAGSRDADTVCPAGQLTNI